MRTPHGGRGGSLPPRPPAAEPAVISVTVWHNVARDTEGRHTAMTGGYQPGDPVVRVFTYLAEMAGQTPEAMAEEAFAICNGHPADAAGAELSPRYYARQLRSVSKGDVVAVGEAALAVAGIGWTPVRGSLHEVRTSEHGTRPLPSISPCKEPGT